MKKQIALLLFMAASFTVNAQSIEEQLTQKRVSCYDVFSNASDVVPELYKSGSFDSIQHALNVVQHYCDSNYAPLFYLQTLLAIQQSSFAIKEIPQGANWSDWLQNYAVRFHPSYQANKYSYYHDNAETKLSQLIQLWATNLLAAKKLTDNEAFICNVLAGNIKNPVATIKANKQKYPELYALLRKGYSSERNHPNGNVALISGVWLPSGNAKLLGVHPSLGFQVGGRSKRNGIDLTMDFRFINAANTYTFLRKDSLYSTKHFLGGYIGLDYTRYIVHTTNFELGLTGGIGYDGFDVTDEPKYDDRKDDTKPYTIGCLNLNAGLRFNYYFNPNFYIGIGGKYNKINYKNTGGTNLHGNTISLDFFIGGNGLN